MAVENKTYINSGYGESSMAILARGIARHFSCGKYTHAPWPYLMDYLIMNDRPCATDDLLSSTCKWIIGSARPVSKNPKSYAFILAPLLTYVYVYVPGADPDSAAGGANYGERGSASLFGGLGACLQWGPWSGGQRDEVPLKLTRFCIFKFKFVLKNAPFLRNLNRSHHAENVNSIYILPVCPIVTNGLNNGLL